MLRRRDVLHLGAAAALTVPFPAPCRAASGNGTQQLFWSDQNTFYGSTHQITGAVIETGVGNWPEAVRLVSH